MIVKPCFTAFMAIMHINCDGNSLMNIIFTNMAEFIAAECYIVIWSSLTHNFCIRSATGTFTLLCNI